jgi:two-component system chemotaxis sensor kinase CheA
MMALFSQFIDYFVPDRLKRAEPGTKCADDRAKARLVIGVSLCMTPIVLLMWAARVAAEQGKTSPTIIALPILASLVLLNPVLVKFTRSHKIASLLTMALTLFIIPLRMFHTGGLNSAIVAWFGVIPVWFGLAWNARAGLIGTFIAICELVLLGYFHQIGIVPAAEPPATAQVVVAAFAILVGAFGVNIYDAQRRRYENLLLAQSQALSIQKGYVEDLNQLLHTMLDSVGQGFLLFDADGMVLPTYSRACETLFGMNPKGKKIWDVLRCSESEKQTNDLWLGLLFRGQHDFYSLRSLGPHRYVSSSGAIIQLEYFPVAPNGPLVSVVMVATDVTEELTAKEQAVRDRSQATMIVKMARHSSAFIRFNATLTDFLSRAPALLDDIDNGSEVILRDLHTMKGTSSSLSIMAVADLTHVLEEKIIMYTALSQEKRKAARPEINENLAKLRKLAQEVIKDFSSVIGTRHGPGQTFRRITGGETRAFLELLKQRGEDSLAAEFAHRFVNEPVGEQVAVYNDMAQEIADRLNKKIKPIKVINGDLLLDPEPYLPLFESFVHAFRNAIDHGIEPAGKRQEMGKDPEGEITVKFEPVFRGGSPWLQIEVGDDGRGIDPGKIREKAKALGVGEPPHDKPDDEVLQLIFASEFTTRTEVTEYSGRGVGLNVVKTEARKLGGYVHVRSQIGVGTTISIDVPVIGSLKELPRAKIA